MSSSRRWRGLTRLASQPRLALAYALKSHVHLVIGSHGGDPVASAALARPAAARALELAPDAWESLSAAGSIAALLDFDWAAAQHYFDKAAAVPGHEVWADNWYLAMLVAQNRLELCLTQMRQALHDYSVPSRSLQQNYGSVLHLAGRFEEAEAEFIQTAETFPDDYTAWMWRGMQAFTLGSRAQSIHFMLRSAIVSRGRLPGTLFQSARDFLLTGRFETPQAFPGGGVETTRVFVSATNRSDAAIDALERMVESRNAIAGVYLRVPLLGYLHGNPRFLALFDKMRIPRPGNS